MFKVSCSGLDDLSVHGGRRKGYRNVSPLLVVKFIYLNKWKEEDKELLSDLGIVVDCC